VLHGSDSLFENRTVSVHGSKFFPICLETDYEMLKSGPKSIDTAARAYPGPAT
jgi:hypothetical protein